VTDPRRPARSSTRSYAPLVRRRAALRWSPRITTGALLGGAIGATTAVPIALDGGGPAAVAGWWALGGVSTALAAWGGVHRLRLAAFGPEGARRRALEEEIWAAHTRAVPGGEVVDAPGQQRWRFSQALGAVERAVADLPSAERSLLLPEARTVAVGASRLLRDAPSLGQATLVVFPEARFGRLDLTGDETLVAGAGPAYRRLLDDAERQLRDLAGALAELSRARAAGATVGGPEVARLHALVSLAELDADPATRGPEPAIERAADRIRAEAAATCELDGTDS